VHYDSIGVGSGVKAEINRLTDDGLLPEGVSFASWNAGAWYCTRTGASNLTTARRR
jgi:hypothetical protein